MMPISSLFNTNFFPLSSTAPYYGYGKQSTWLAALNTVRTNMTTQLEGLCALYEANGKGPMKPLCTPLPPAAADLSSMTQLTQGFYQVRG